MTALEAVARKLDEFVINDDRAGEIPARPYVVNRSDLLARIAAEALFAALEEPSEGMVQAGEATGRDQHCAGEDGNWHEWREHDPDEVWRTMLAQAKREVLG